MKANKKTTDLQRFAGSSGAGEITINPREVDFVTSFGREITALTEAMGISRPIAKANGTQLVAMRANGELLSGDVPAGEEIPLSQFGVEPVSFEEIRLQKYRKATTLEDIARYGAAAAIDRTDDEFKAQLQGEVLAKFYNFLITGQLTDSGENFQKALAKAVGRVKDAFKKMHRTATGVAAFVNTLDVYDYLGGAPVSTQSAFGMEYIKDFLGADIVFISSEIPQNHICATPVNNIVAYYVDPANAEFREAGLVYTTDPQVPYVGYCTQGAYARAQSESFAIMGLTLFAEFLNAIAVITIGEAPALKTLTATTSAGATSGTVKIAVQGNQTSNIKYRLANEAITVNYGQNVRNWASLDPDAEIAASEDQVLTVVEYDEYYKAVGSGSVAMSVTE